MLKIDPFGLIKMVGRLDTFTQWLLIESYN